MAHQLWIVFGWPAGIVVGNMLANLIWMVVHDWPQHRATRKRIEKHSALCRNCRGTSQEKAAAHETPKATS